MSPTFVIVGGGQAGAQAAASLRQEGFEGRIVVVGEEAFPPYQRPPLSKQFLAGMLDASRLAIRSEAYWAEHAIELRRGSPVTELDRDSRCVRLADGETLRYDALLLATGGRARTLAIPGAALEGVHRIRTIADVEALRDDVRARDGARVVLVGGGYVGLEVAAVLRGLGCAVRVVELEERLLARVASPTVARFVTALHEAQGVAVSCSTAVAELRGDARVREVVTTTGECFAADVVVIGVGLVPATDLAERAGLACDGGIVVDERGATSDPRVFAAGDVTSQLDPETGRRRRIESVDNAVAQGKAVAAAMLGRPAAPRGVPWFWSDQYDLKIQMLGLADPTDDEVVRGVAEDGKLSVFHLRQRRIVGATMLRRPAEFMAARPLVAARACIAPERLADVSVPLRELQSAV